MAYCILRLTKHKTWASLDAAYDHNYRMHDVPNADSSLSSQNEELIHGYNGRYPEAALQHIKAFSETMKIDESGTIFNGDRKIRSDAVLACEVVLNFSSEAAGTFDAEAWKKAQVEFLKSNFDSGIPGKPSNVISVVCHVDEVCGLHCHAMIVPIDHDGLLRAKSFIDGPSFCRDIQDKYAEAMKPFELKRGTKGSAAKHMELKEFYAAVNRSTQTSAPEPLNGESIASYSNRCSQAFKELAAQYEYKMLNLKAKPDKKLKDTVKENISLIITVNELKSKLEPYEELERDYGSYKEIAGRCQATRAIEEGTKAVFENINEYHEYNNLLMAIMQEGRRILEKEAKKKKKEKSMDYSR